MELGVDATWLPLDRRGMGRYVRHVTAALLAAPEVRVTLFSRSRGDESALRAMFPGRSFAFAAWHHPALDRLDICWFPWNRVDVAPRTRRVVTIHDAAAFDWPLPGPLAFLDNRKAQRQLRAAADRADRVVTVSEFSRRRLLHHLGERRIDVVTEGVDPAEFHPTSPPAPERPFALFVGAADPRKNRDGLLQAWARTERCGRVLRVVGDGAGAGGPDVEYCPGVADADLRDLYSACDLFVMPSRYEGFGLPVLEAMACGAPVAASRAAALPEVAGEAAWLFDPEPDDMARVLGEALSDEPGRQAKRAAGRGRAAAFTWERAARQVLDVLGEVAASAAAGRS